MNHAVERSVNKMRPSYRRLVRYCMRSALVFITVVVCIVGWATNTRRQSELERQIGEDFRDQGAKVQFVGIYDSLDLQDAGKPQGWWRDWARHLLGERVRWVQVSKPYELEDLDVLRGLTRLTGLGVNDTVLDDLTPLSTLRKLRVLDLRSTSVKDISPISGLKELEDLSLASTSVSDVSPLAAFQELEFLILSETSVSDLSPLSRLKTLRRLDLRSTSISDVSPLAELKTLEELSIADTSVSDVSPLAGLTQLRSLLLGGTSASDEQVSSLQEALPNCSIIR